MLSTTILICFLASPILAGNVLDRKLDFMGRELTLQIGLNPDPVTTTLCGDIFIQLKDVYEERMVLCGVQSVDGYIKIGSAETGINSRGTCKETETIKSMLLNCVWETTIRLNGKTICIANFRNEGLDTFAYIKVPGAFIATASFKNGNMLKFKIVDANDETVIEFPAAN